MIHIQKEDLDIHRLPKKSLLNLHMKMIGLMAIMVVTMIVLIGGFLSYFVKDMLETQIGEKAMSVATSVSLIPELIEAFDAENPSVTIQPIVKRIQEQTDAEFIVIGNRDEIRYAHPNSSRIGKKMVGEDNTRALIEGESYTSKSTGTLGDSLRAKVPIYSHDEIVGVVSVGFLAESIDSIIFGYSKEIWLVLIVIAALAIAGAALISTYIKKSLFGLEPEEISHLLFQKETILHSIHEGIIAVNTKGQITMINSAALNLLTDEEQQTESFIGQSIQKTFPNSELLTVLANGKTVSDQEKIVGEHIIYVNSVPILFENELIGAVSTFRNKTEIEQLTKELTHVQQYANAMRAQTHEFSNKLYTILGMTRLDKKEEVLAFIQAETIIQDEWIHILLDDVRDPFFSGLLIGKLNQASELQIKVEIQQGSQLHMIIEEPGRHALLTAIGNLLDNAFEAVYDEQAHSKDISLFFTDVGHEVIVEIDDAGPGLPEAMVQTIFNKGMSTKKGNGRGFGLAITQKEIEAAKGQLLLESSELGGTCFVVSIPKIQSGGES